MSSYNNTYEKHEDYMVRRLKELDYSELAINKEKVGKHVPFVEREILKMKEDIKKLQIDIAYMMKKNG